VRNPVAYKVRNRFQAFAFKMRNLYRYTAVCYLVDSPPAYGGAVHVDSPCSIAERRLVFKRLPLNTNPGFQNVPFKCNPAPLRYGDTLDPRDGIARVRRYVDDALEERADPAVGLCTSNQVDP
jgi:hypothetical protein